MSIRRTIGIIVFDTVRTCEVTAPLEVFALASQQAWFADTKIYLIGVEEQASIRTAEGLSINVDCTIKNSPALDVLIVPGAYDVSALLQHEGLNSFLRFHSKSAQWAASFCAGAFLLAHAGALNGRKATTWQGGEATLQAQFPEVDVQFDSPVVLDQRRLTANGGLVSYRASLTLLAQLSSEEHAQEIYDALSIAKLGEWLGVANH